MQQLVLQFVLSTAMVVTAGIFLAKAADAIAEATKLGRLLVGSILLAGATSLPELFVDISAIRREMPDLAVGDLFGSSLMNLLILAAADLLHRNPQKMFSRIGAQHALAAVMSINITALAGIAIFLGPQLQHIAIGEIGIGPLAIGLFYVLGLRLVYFDQKIAATTAERVERKGQAPNLAYALSTYAAAALVIMIAAPFLAESAGKIAEITGLGTTFVGATLVALCTSLPELVSTLVAVRMGAFDLAVGNIFGSNAFNMLLLIPLDWFHSGDLLASVAHSHLLMVLAIVVTTSVAIMGQLYHEEKRKRFLDPDAIAIIIIALASLYALYLVRI